MTPPLRVLVVDDETPARDGVRALLSAEEDVVIVGECADGYAAVERLRLGSVDVVLLDIQMPGLDGLGVLRQVPEEVLPVVVFLTAHDRYAVQAFEASALDFVVKPFSDARFRTAMARARRQVQQRRLGEAGAGIAEIIGLLRGAPTTPAHENAPPPRGRWIDRIPVRSVGRTVYVRVADIEWIGSADYYVQLHTADGKKHLVRESMQRIEERLDPSVFTRVHRTAIVRIDQVTEIRTDGAERHIVVLRNGARLPLGKSRREGLERRLASR